MAFVEGGYVTSPFGARNKADIFSRGINRGLDIAVPRGTPIELPNGRWQVVKVFNKATAEGPNNRQRGINEGYGNQVVVVNLDTGEKLSFAHLSQAKVRNGDLLNGGVVGYSGATGNTAGKTGNHVDIEYYDATGQLKDVAKSSYWEKQQNMPDVNLPKQSNFSIVKPAMAAERSFNNTVVPTPPTYNVQGMQPVRSQVQPLISSQPSTNTQLIKRGDTLSGIATAYNTNYQSILKMNPQIKDPNKIYAGDVLYVPQTRLTPVNQSKPIPKKVQSSSTIKATSRYA